MSYDIIVLPMSDTRRQNTMSIRCLFWFCLGTTLLTTVYGKCNENESLGDSSRIDQLLERVSALEKRDAIQQTLIVELKKELSDQKKYIWRMKQALAARDRRIWLLLHSFRQKATSVNNEKQAETEKEMLERSEDKQPASKQEQSARRIRQMENEMTVAFSAALSKTMSLPGIHQNIVFDHVFTNIGNGYNAHHGVFLAPVSGTYVFFVTVYATHNHDVWCQFVVNSIHKSTVYAESLNSAEDTSSQTIILQLQQGDDVAIQLIKNTTEIYGSPNLYSTFSGFLLKQDTSQPGSIIG